MNESEARPKSGANRVLLWVPLPLVAAALLLVLALPGAPPQRYPDRIPVRFWHMWTAEWKAVVDRIVDRFNESQEVYEVIPLSIPATGSDAKFLLAVAGGDPPDAMSLWEQVIPKWAERGVLQPLEPLMNPEQWEQFQRTTYPAALRIGMYKGRLYGVTTGIDIAACFVRLDDLREAGLDPRNFPETMEELVAWGGKLNKFAPDGSLMRIGFLPTSLGGFALEQYAPVFGGGFYDWSRGEMTINTPENLRALSFLAEQRRSLGFDKVLRFESGLALGTSNVQWPFISDAYSITVDGQWRVEQLAKFAPGLEYATFPVPPPAGGRKHAGWANGNFIVIPTGAKQAKGAWEFIKFWAGIEAPERAAEFYTWGGWLPMNAAIANAPAFREYLRANPCFRTFLDVLPSENLQPTPPVTYQTFLTDRIRQAVEAAQRGILSPKASLDRLEEAIQREIAMKKRP